MIDKYDDGTHTRVDRDGGKYWEVAGNLHRDNDKPAIIAADGAQGWFRYGRCHRDGDKPAFISAEGSQQWYQHGQLHRDGDKPAIIWAGGEQQWWRNGQRVAEQPHPACAVRAAISDTDPFKAAIALADALDDPKVHRDAKLEAKSALKSNPELAQAFAELNPVLADTILRMREGKTAQQGISR